MIAQHLIYDTYKPDTLMEEFKEAAVLWKEMEQKRFLCGVYKAQK